LGLLLQRTLTSTILICLASEHLPEATKFASSLPHLIAAIAGLLLIFGLWTPLAGIAIAVGEGWILFSGWENPLIAILLAGSGATLAMIGPGVWSIDAQLYGRKHIEPSRS
jgi:uncharacterized membrane protein YphA (DoxX/SURF4 family)